MDIVFIYVITSITILIGYRYVKKRKEKNRLRKKLLHEWGKAASREHNWTQIKLYYQLKSTAANTVDDDTWQDLNMGDVFALMDRTQSYPGQQVLYDVLKCPVWDQSILQNRDKAIEIFAKNEDLRTDLQMELQKLTAFPFWGLPNIILKPLPDVPKWYKLFFLIPALGIIFILLGFLVPIFFLALIAVPIINMVIQYVIGGEVSKYTVPLGALGTFIRTAEKIGDSLESKQFENTGLSISKELQALSKLKKRVGKFMPQGFQDELATMVKDYLNLFFLLNINMFTLSVSAISKHKEDLASLYRKVGLIDTFISAASFRESLPKVSEPRFVKGNKGISLEEAYHPLLDEPVANSISIGERGWLITGSNMSGKSTFLKTIGVNMILAQSLNFCCAQKANIPFCNVVSSMRREDNITEGKSYYLGEVERVKELLDKKDESSCTLFLLDEIFRGTNTLERVSASMHVLKWLNGPGKYVAASTHDLELVELLEAEFEFYHFAEEVSGDKLSFDFKLRPGHASTRNAIKLLAIWDYPPKVVQGALDTSEELEQKGFHSLQ